MQTALTNDARSYLAPAADLQAATLRGSRKIRAIAARMERPATVGELVACASALCALGESFYVEVDTTPNARVAGLVGAWICSDPSLVQLGEAPEECFHPLTSDDDRRVYVTADSDPHSRDRYLWTFIKAGRAWLVLVEWRAEFR